MNTKEILKKFIEEVLLDNETQVEYDTMLIESELLDSLTIAELITFIEEIFSVTISDDDFDIENFNTIDSLAELIERMG